MRGYKVFNPDWTCRDFQFEIGKTYEEDVQPACCERGFHFCTKAADCFNYYDFNPDNKVAEVEALGDIDTNNNDSKCSTNKIHIIREITWPEVLDLVNLGKGCTGLGNSGDCNSGNYNSGYRNSGDCNSGNYNSGNYNSGNYNSGDRNSGNRNSGHCNSGNQNSGNWNSGNRNSGHCNSGDYNSGDYNSGDRNSGHCNSGNRNSGHCNSGNRNSGHCNSGNQNSGHCNSGNQNSGNYNSGDYNSGHCNSGDYNSGDWNKTCFSNGCFNTKSPKIFLFNKPSDWTYQDWLNSKAREVLRMCPCNILEWRTYENMTDEEEKQHPEYSVTGGFLAYIENDTRRQMWWNELSDIDKDAVMSLPNFDKEIFKEITGIDVGDVK